MKEGIHRINRTFVFIKFQDLVIISMQKWICFESVSWRHNDSYWKSSRSRSSSREMITTGIMILIEIIKVARRRRCVESSTYRVAARWSVEQDKNTNDQSKHFRDDVTRYARCLRSHRFGTHDDTILLRDEIRKITRRNQERVHIFWDQTSVEWMMWIWHKRLHWFLQEWVILSSCGTDYKRLSARGYEISLMQRRTRSAAYT